MSKGFRAVFALVWLVIVLALALAGCGSDQATPTPARDSSAPPTVIPTFTPARATPLPIPTITPTPIVVPPTDTPAPTETPLPTLPPTRPPTATPPPTTPPRPTTALPTLAQSQYQEISVDQARNLNGYRTLLPTYLPAGFKLGRITYSQINNSPVFSLVVVFENDQAQTFYLNIQYVPPLPTVTPTATPAQTPLLTLPVAPLATPTLPPSRTGPYPTAASGDFVQYAVRVRNTAGLLSYSNSFTSLSWSEASGSYALNGLISPDEALKVAASLS
jgi:hypothetical protein